MLDKAYNFAKSIISPLASGAVSVTLTDPSKFIDPASGEYNCTIWCSSLFASPTEDPNKEIVRFTAKSGSDYTITRAQEGTTDVDHNTVGESYSIAIGITAKMITDIASELGEKELTSNKSNDVSGDAASTTKYPSVKAFKDYTDGKILGLLNYRGAYDASVNTYPATGGSGTGGAVLKGDMWIISVAGTLGGEAVQIGDSIIANIDTPGQTAGNWNPLNGNISYVPENAANKVTSISGSSTDVQYPSAKLLFDQLAGKVANFTSQTANYVFASPNGSAGTPSFRALVAGDIPALAYEASGATATHAALQTGVHGISITAGKTLTVQDNVTITGPLGTGAYATIADYATLANPTFTGTVILPKNIEIQDTSADHQYVLAVSELAADRTITLPLLTGNDIFMFRDFHKSTSAEINTGTENDKYITPDGFAGSIPGKRIVQLKIVDDSTVVATGNGKLIFVIPEELNGMNLIQAESFCSTVSSSGLPTVQIRNVTDSVDMLSTRITIDATEYTSYTAEARSAVDGTHDDVATGDLIAIDVDVSGTGTRGLGIILSFQLP